MKRLARAGAILGALLCLAGASDPAERLPDPGQEARARHLFEQFRCVACQNESIDDSEAEIAHDLRKVVRDQVAQGRSDAEIRAFMVSRYGQFILLKPMFNAGNALLWLAPLLALGSGLAGFLVITRRKSAPEPALDDVEEARLRALTAEKDG